MSQQSTAAVYTHGHHESVLRSHTWRTAANSAAFLLPHLKPHMRILDVGCGPGTISIDLATYVPQGEVVGVDASNDPLIVGRQTATERGVSNVRFEAADALKLPFDDASFDVVYSHQVLQHVGDPVGVLREMRRVTKKGGLVASREVDFGMTEWYPESQDLHDFLTAYLAVARKNGGDPKAGTRLHVWAREAGFAMDKAKLTGSTWVYASEEERAWWSSLWADRILKSGLRETALKHDLATEDDLQRFANAWTQWGSEPDGLTVLVNGEIICEV